jgi:hypothetical protein
MLPAGADILVPGRALFAVQLKALMPPPSACVALHF